MSIENELRQLRMAGHSQESAARALGIDRNKLRRLLLDYGVSWPHKPAVKTRFRGRMRTLREVARITGLPLGLVHNRYWRGRRGEELAAPRDDRRTRKAYRRTGAAA